MALVTYLDNIFYSNLWQDVKGQCGAAKIKGRTAYERDEYRLIIKILRELRIVGNTIIFMNWIA